MRACPPVRDRVPRVAGFRDRIRAGRNARFAQFARVALLTALLVALAGSAGCGGNGLPPSSRLRQLSAAEAGELWRSQRGQERFLLLDIRTPAEFAAERIAGAVNVDFRSPTFRDEIAKLPKDQTVLLYCRSGNRSGQSLPLFLDLGFRDVRHLEGGILAWKGAGLPVEAGETR